MTNLHWAKLGVKLIGLWAMISSLRSLTNVVEAIYITAKANTIAALVRAFIGFGLVVGSERLAKGISGMRGRHSLNE
jgi:hypothetical protein